MEPAGSYVLTVEDGEGGGTYAAGEQVSISTEPFNGNGHFVAWVANDSTGTGVIADPSARETTFTMPAGDVTLSAYEPHALRNHAAQDPTCADAGWEAYDECATCGYATAHQELPATGHTFEDGTCTVCGAEDPDYVAPEKDESLPAAGDASALFSAVPALVGATALAAGARLRRRR